MWFQNHDRYGSWNQSPQIESRGTLGACSCKLQLLELQTLGFGLCDGAFGELPTQSAPDSRSRAAMPDATSAKTHKLKHVSPSGRSARLQAGTWARRSNVVNHLPLLLRRCSNFYPGLMGSRPSVLEPSVTPSSPIVKSNRRRTKALACGCTTRHGFSRPRGLRWV